jgi:predicted dehydrogenase
MRIQSVLGALLILASITRAADLRIGIIGCDTSHVTAFTEVLNDPSATGHVQGGTVVAAFKGGSKDIPASWSRVDQYSNTLKEKYQVTFYDTIEEMCGHVDSVMLESVDGRPHLEQARPVLRAHKRLFVDKPIAGSLRDAVEIFKLAKEQGTPVFSSSALRFGTKTQAVRNGSLGKVLYAETYGPCEIEPHHPDLFWYGVHGVEALYTMMGTGCEKVERTTTAGGRIQVIGLWPDGRQGIFREDKEFHGLAKGDKGETAAGSFDGYLPLVSQIMKFFQTGVAPVKPQETLEIFAFMEAADESKRVGAPVKIADMLKRAGATAD